MSGEIVELEMIDKNETEPEAVVQVEPETKSPQKEFSGLSKEELLKFANDPFWVRLRWGLFIAFWVLWLGLLVAAILIIVLTPKCPPKPDDYTTGILYKVSHIYRISDSCRVAILATIVFIGLYTN